MDKKAIKNFAIESRQILRDGVITKLTKLGINEKEVEEAIIIETDLIEIPSSKERYSGKDVVNRNKLITELERKEKQLDQSQKNTFQLAFEVLVEEVAYTWFNRLIAIRFLEVNDYLPERIRILSSETSGKREPDIITNLLDSDLFKEMDSETQEKVVELLSDNSAGAVDELYQLVFIKQCNSLNKELPNLFEKIDDYTELLFSISYIDDNGVIANLLTIPESDFDVREEGQVEIIGWMYQYYNTEPKDKVFARGNRKIRADEIPAATQLFTPDWIVRYMVENSLGRYYIDQKLADPSEERTEKEIADSFGWQYYLPSAEQPEEVQLQILEERKKKNDFDLQELKLIDNAMGSGHVLVYAFDVFLQLYVAEGFRERDASELIMKNNLFGLEIDKRAYQLAYFAIMMKGRQHNRRILSKNISLNLYQFINSEDISEDYLSRLREVSALTDAEFSKWLEKFNSVMNQFKHATEIGSILNIKDFSLNDVREAREQLLLLKEYTNMDILYSIPETHERMFAILNIIEILLTKYASIVTNPPYLNKMSSLLDKYVKSNYPDVKTDLFSVFIKMNSEMLVENGYTGFMTPFVWMFIKSYEHLRGFLIHQKSISSLIQMEYSAFEEATVPVCCFTIKNTKSEPVGNYLKLSEFRGGMEVQEEKVLHAIENNEVKYFYQTNQNNFEKIPGYPISFWVSENLIRNFEIGKQLGKVSEVKKGMFTGQNDLFFRLWSEPSFDKIQLEVNKHSEIQNKNYIPINKGGEFRRWYGNNDFVMKFDSLHYNIIEKNKGHRSPQYYFKTCVEWTKITSGKLALRYSDSGFVNNDASMAIYTEDELLLKTILGVASTKVGQLYVSTFNESMNYTVGDITRIPIIRTTKNKIVSNQVTNCINISKLDWDSFESSWNFDKHPLI
ncbi:BREX-1 system adenine-specific DNA-methyltransferase PglX [Vagococcus fluvialis]|uniref:BREX-1 system adenine-specific DNA-methyltransferase PglX n=1 Tax=Vagococcus fluvialis TaxID=2738 RepID=UPI003B5CDF21